MGTETVKINQGLQGLPSTLRRQDLAQVQFSHHEATGAGLSIWMMSLLAGQPVFPWWSYDATVDEDVNKLSMLAGITSAEGLFEFLFILQLKKAFPPASTSWCRAMSAPTAGPNCLSARRRRSSAARTASTGSTRRSERR